MRGAKWGLGYPEPLRDIWASELTSQKYISREKHEDLLWPPSDLNHLADQHEVTCYVRLSHNIRAHTYIYIYVYRGIA